MGRFTHLPSCVNIMKLVFSIPLALQFLSNSAFSAYCSGTPKKPDYDYQKPLHQQNARLINELYDETSVIGGAGAYYRAGEDKDEFTILHVWGNAYEVGYWHGKLLADDVDKFINSVYKYLENEAYDECVGSDMPPLEKICLNERVARNIIDHGIDAALDWEIEATESFTPEHVETEMRGLSDGSGVDLQLIRRIHQLGELTKAACSMFGAWDKALPSGSGLMQMRALDWSVDGPFIDWPQVTVYHPSNPNENAFANVGFPGFIGLITGMNDQKMGISEIGASYSGEVAFPGESRHGYPFTWMLRDMLQFNSTGDAALETMQNADRTCNLILGVGDGKPESQVFHGVSSDAELLTVYTDTYLMPKVNDDGVDMTHEDIENVVYWGMDWFCPAFHKQLHDRIVENWGAITAENTMRDIIPRTNTGNMHIAVYDYNNWDMYVAFARQSKYVGVEDGGELNAWERSYTRLPMEEIFSLKSPKQEVTTEEPVNGSQALVASFICVLAVFVR